MVEIKPLICPQCGSQDLEELSWNRRKCRHCGTESALSEDRTRLDSLERVCPQCGAKNGEHTRFCQQCGGPLTRVCAVCGNESYVQARFCGACGFELNREADFWRVEADLAAARHKVAGLVARKGGGRQSPAGTVAVGLLGAGLVFLAAWWFRRVHLPVVSTVLAWLIVLILVASVATAVWVALLDAQVRPLKNKIEELEQERRRLLPPGQLR